jgi:hypothetical protein
MSEEEEKEEKEQDRRVQQKNVKRGKRQSPAETYQALRQITPNIINDEDEDDPEEGNNKRGKNQRDILVSSQLPPSMFPGPQQFPPGPQQFPPGPQQFPPGPQQFPPGPQQFPPVLRPSNWGIIKKNLQKIGKMKEIANEDIETENLQNVIDIVTEIPTSLQLENYGKLFIKEEIDFFPINPEHDVDDEYDACEYDSEERGKERDTLKYLGYLIDKTETSLNLKINVETILADLQNTDADLRPYVDFLNPHREKKTNFIKQYQSQIYLLIHVNGSLTYVIIFDSFHKIFYYAYKPIGTDIYLLKNKRGGSSIYDNSKQTCTNGFYVLQEKYRTRIEGLGVYEYYGNNYQYYLLGDQSLSFYFSNATMPDPEKNADITGLTRSYKKTPQIKLVYTETETVYAEGSSMESSSTVDVQKEVSLFKFSLIPKSVISEPDLFISEDTVIIDDPMKGFFYKIQVTLKTGVTLELYYYPSDNDIRLNQRLSKFYLYHADNKYHYYILDEDGYYYSDTSSIYYYIDDGGYFIEEDDSSVALAREFQQQFPRSPSQFGFQQQGQQTTGFGSPSSSSRFQQQGSYFIGGPPPSLGFPQQGPGFGSPSSSSFQQQGQNVSVQLDPYEFEYELSKKGNAKIFGLPNVFFPNRDGRTYSNNGYIFTPSLDGDYGNITDPDGNDITDPSQIQYLEGGEPQKGGLTKNEIFTLLLLMIQFAGKDFHHDFHGLLPNMLNIITGMYNRIYSKAYNATLAGSKLKQVLDNFNNPIYSTLKGELQDIMQKVNNNEYSETDFNDTVIDFQNKFDQKDEQTYSIKIEDINIFDPEKNSDVEFKSIEALQALGAQGCIFMSPTTDKKKGRPNGDIDEQNNPIFFKTFIAIDNKGYPMSYKSDFKTMFENYINFADNSISTKEWAALFFETTTVEFGNPGEEVMVQKISNAQANEMQGLFDAITLYYIFGYLDPNSPVITKDYANLNNEVAYNAARIKFADKVPFIEPFILNQQLSNAMVKTSAMETIEIWLNMLHPKSADRIEVLDISKIQGFDSKKTDPYEGILVSCRKADRTNFTVSLSNGAGARESLADLIKELLKCNINLDFRGGPDAPAILTPGPIKDSKILMELAVVYYNNIDNDYKTAALTTLPPVMSIFADKTANHVDEITIITTQYPAATRYNKFLLSLCLLSIKMSGDLMQVIYINIFSEKYKQTYPTPTYNFSISSTDKNVRGLMSLFGKFRTLFSSNVNLNNIVEDIVNIDPQIQIGGARQSINFYITTLLGYFNRNIEAINKTKTTPEIEIGDLMTEKGSAFTTNYSKINKKIPSTTIKLNADMLKKLQLESENKDLLTVLEAQRRPDREGRVQILNEEIQNDTNYFYNKALDFVLGDLSSLEKQKLKDSIFAKNAAAEAKIKLLISEIGKANTRETEGSLSTVGLYADYKVGKLRTKKQTLFDDFVLNIGVIISLISLIANSKDTSSIKSSILEEVSIELEIATTHLLSMSEYTGQPKYVIIKDLIAAAKKVIEDTAATTITPEPAATSKKRKTPDKINDIDKYINANINQFIEDINTKKTSISESIDTANTKKEETEKITLLKMEILYLFGENTSIIKDIDETDVKLEISDLTYWEKERLEDLKLSEEARLIMNKEIVFLKNEILCNCVPKLFLSQAILTIDAAAAAMLQALDKLGMRSDFDKLRALDTPKNSALVSDEKLRQLTSLIIASFPPEREREPSPVLTDQNQLLIILSNLLYIEKYKDLYYSIFSDTNKDWIKTNKAKNISDYINFMNLVPQYVGGPVSSLHTFIENIKRGIFKAIDSDTLNLMSKIKLNSSPEVSLRNFEKKINSLVGQFNGIITTLVKIKELIRDETTVIESLDYCNSLFQSCLDKSKKIVEIEQVVLPRIKEKEQIIGREAEITYLISQLNRQDIDPIQYIKIVLKLNELEVEFIGRELKENLNNRKMPFQNGVNQIYFIAVNIPTLIAQNGLQIDERDERIIAYNIIQARGAREIAQANKQAPSYEVSDADIEHLINVFRLFNVDFSPSQILEKLLEESRESLNDTIRKIEQLSFIDFQSGVAQGSNLSSADIDSWVNSWRILDSNISKLKEGYRLSQNKTDALEQISNALITILNVQMQLLTFSLPDKIIKDVLIKQIELINSWEHFSNIKKFEPSKTKIFCQSISKVKTFIEKNLSSFMKKCTDYLSKLIGKKQPTDTQKKNQLEAAKNIATNSEALKKELIKFLEKNQAVFNKKYESISLKLTTEVVFLHKIPKNFRILEEAIKKAQQQAVTNFITSVDAVNAAEAAVPVDPYFPGGRAKRKTYKKKNINVKKYTYPRNHKKSKRKTTIKNKKVNKKKYTKENR